MSRSYKKKTGNLEEKKKQKTVLDRDQAKRQKEYERLAWFQKRDEHDQLDDFTSKDQRR